MTSQKLSPGLQLVPIDEIIVDSSRSARLFSHTDEYIKDLSDHVQTHGLLSPIVIDTNCNLLRGFARIKACKSIGSTEVLCNVVESEEPLSWKVTLRS